MIALDTAGPTAPRAESAAEFLARTPLFSDMDPELRKQLAVQSQARHLAAGQWLYRQHEHFDGYSAVLIQLRKVSARALRDAITDGWLACAPPALTAKHVR